MTTDTRDRSRHTIHNFIFQSCITQQGEDGTRYPSSYGFIDDVFFEDRKRVQVGDLVIVTCVTAGTKWNLGWLVGIEEEGERYIVESLEDGSTCSWGNCGLKHLPRDKVRPEWRWTDRQWAFYDRWNRVCKKSDFPFRPIMPVFEGNKVTIGLRSHIWMHGKAGEDKSPTTRTFHDWRKLTKKLLGTCFDELSKEREAE